MIYKLRKVGAINMANNKRGCISLKPAPRCETLTAPLVLTELKLLPKALVSPGARLAKYRNPIIAKNTATIEATDQSGILLL